MTLSSSQNIKLNSPKREVTGLFEQSCLGWRDHQNMLANSKTSTETTFCPYNNSV
jgi:hypothetical protein